MATWPKPNQSQAQDRYSATLGISDVKGRYPGNSKTEHLRDRTGLDNLGLSLVPDGQALSEVSSFHTASMSSDRSDFQVSFVESYPRRPISSRGVTIGDISIICTFLLFVVGIILVSVVFKNQNREVKIVLLVLRAAGLFGFAGGVTNWLGVKLIFNRIPGVFFSGAVTRHFVSAKNLVASFILGSFFSPSQVKQYLDDKKRAYLTPEQLDNQLEKLLNSTTVETIINDHLEVLMGSPEGLRLRMLGITRAKLTPLVRPYLSKIKGYIVPVLLSSMELVEVLNAEQLREQIVDLISTRTHELTAPQVKRESSKPAIFLYDFVFFKSKFRYLNPHSLLVKDAVYRHLSWLVFWGSVLGALIGCLAEVASVYVRGIPT